MTRPTMLGLAFLLLTAACESGLVDGTPKLFSEGSGVRTVHTASYDTIWHYGGLNDTILGAPTRLVAAPDNALYVLDPMLQQVIRLSPSGDLDWRWGRKGEGPGELGNVRALDVTPDGGVVLADSGNCRLVFLSAHGVLEREDAVVCADFGLMEGVAALASGDVVLDTNRPGNPWILQSASGEQDSVRVPWPGLEGMHFLQRYGNVGRSDGDVWVFGFEAGNGWFVLERDKVLGVFPYVEHTDFPEVIVSQSGNRTMWRMAERPAYSAYDLNVWKDTLYVVPGGHTEHRFRVLDKYGIRSGEYLHSQALPDFTDGVAVTGDRVFVLNNRELYPQITSLRRKGDEQ